MEGKTKKKFNVNVSHLAIYLVCSLPTTEGLTPNLYIKNEL